MFQLIETIGWSNILFMVHILAKTGLCFYVFFYCKYWRHLDTYVCSIYFITLVIIGFYIILNLFLAVLYDGFQIKQSIKSIYLTSVVGEVKVYDKQGKTSI